MDERKVTNRECMELLRERTKRLFWKIADEKEDIHIDGVRGYNDKAQFVGGKVINLCSYVALSFAGSREEQERMLDALRDIIDMCAGMKMETWGILNGLTGLYRLKAAGVYERTVSSYAQEQLQRSMDWHTFVDAEKDYALIHKPTNYYGVAFGIARWRELLGWDAMGSSAILLEHLLDHISRYSGEYGFMDETRGEGRFDRYSILIPAEITELVLNTGWEEPELIRRMLKKSAQIVLQMASDTGWGFSYGRSIGAYGETAVLQILAAAAQLGDVLTAEEEKLAFAYSLLCIRRMILFWYDEEMESVNLWNKGRRTDGYRNKNRILGENLSLFMQVIDVIEQWKSLGYDCGAEEEGSGLEGMYPDGLYFTRFAKDMYDRGLVICRRKGHVWSLPVICGGTPYYNKDAYLPVPRENGVLEAVPDVSHGALVPRIRLQDGQELMPICFADSIEPCGRDGIKIHYGRLCRLEGNSPEPWTESKDMEIEAETTYWFLDGRIRREDVLTIGGKLPVKEIRLCFDTFSENAAAEGERIDFLQGPIRSICTENYGNGSIKEWRQPVQEEPEGEPVDLSAAGQTQYRMPADSLDTPHGPNKTQIVWRRPCNGEHRLVLAWELAF